VEEKNMSKPYLSREKISMWYEKNDRNKYLLHKLNPSEHGIFLSGKIKMKNNGDSVGLGLKLKLDDSDFLDSSEIIQIEEKNVHIGIIDVNNVNFANAILVIEILDDSWIEWK
jgi:hypothetical protein